jgi:hypothetical protein
MVTPDKFLDYRAHSGDLIRLVRIPSERVCVVCRLVPIGRCAMSFGLVALYFSLLEKGDHYADGCS